MRTLESDIFGRPVRKTINSKNKGNSNEREAAKWLKRWTGCPFARVPMSGGLRWKNNANVCGDVVCEDDKFYFPFNVETKHLRVLNHEGELSSRSMIYKIWAQAYRDACRTDGKMPMAMLRENGMAAGQFVVYFEHEVGTYISKKVKIVSYGYSPLGAITGFNSEELVTKVTFKDLKEMLGLL